MSAFAGINCKLGSLSASFKFSGTLYTTGFQFLSNITSQSLSAKYHTSLLFSKSNPFLLNSDLVSAVNQSNKLFKASSLLNFNLSLISCVALILIASCSARFLLTVDRFFWIADIVSAVAHSC
jgi:hypothetical protein